MLTHEMKTPNAHEIPKCPGSGFSASTPKQPPVAKASSSRTGPERVEIDRVDQRNLARTSGDKYIIFPCNHMCVYIYIAIKG
jgi:hypothetical protein